MIQGLSKREKILLFAAGLVVILYLSVQFVILPLATRYVSSLSERDHLRTEQAKIDADINNKAAIENENREANQRFEAIKKEYPLLVPNEEVATILTNLCITNGLSPSMLSISPPPTATTQTTQEGEEQSESLFTIITATINVSGTYNSLTRLLDEVDEKQFIRITNMTYREQRQQNDDAINVLPETDVTLNFELTFVNP